MPALPMDRPDDVLNQHIPADKLAEVRRLLYGVEWEELAITEEAAQLAAAGDFEVRGYTKRAAAEQLRGPNVVRYAAIQNSIAVPTTEPVAVQRDAIFAKVGRMLDAAGAMHVNVVCLQEAWSTFARPGRAP